MIAVVTAIIVALVLLAVAYVGVSGWPLLRSGDRRIRSGFGCCGRDRQPRDHPTGRRTDPARTGTARRYHARSAHDHRRCRRCLPAHRRSRSRSNGWRIIIFPTRMTTLTFALLSDWQDSDTQHAAGDDDTSRARHAAGIARLNARYGPVAERPALLPAASPAPLERAAKARWIGWERKRGKLHELNRLLRGATDTTFMPIDGNAAGRCRRHPLCHHARCRYAPADRRRQAAGRQDGASR